MYIDIDCVIDSYLLISQYKSEKIQQFPSPEKRFLYILLPEEYLCSIISKEKEIIYIY